MATTGAEYGTEFTATTSGIGFLFGINATSLWVANDGASNAFFSLTTTSAASTATATHQLKAGETRSLTPQKGYYTGCSFVVTSSSSGQTTTGRIYATR